LLLLGFNTSNLNRRTQKPFQRLKKITRYYKLMMMTMNKKENDIKKIKLSLPLVFLPDELIAEILSLLNVKTIVRFSLCPKTTEKFLSKPPTPHTHISDIPCWYCPIPTCSSFARKFAHHCFRRLLPWRLLFECQLRGC